MIADMQKINKFRINIVIILVFILLVAVLLGFSWNHYRNVIEENEQVSRTQTEIIQLGQDMQEVSDNLTYPPGIAHLPLNGSVVRFTSNT